MFKKRKTRYKIEFGKTSGWLGYPYYAVLKKNFLFWHTVERCMTFDSAKEFVDRLRQIEDYNEMEKENE